MEEREQGMIHGFSKKTVQNLYGTIKANVDEESQFAIFDYATNLFAEELDIKDYVNHMVI